MKTTMTLIVLLLAVAMNASAQNLLNNGDFEKSPPDGNSIAPVTGWERSHYPPQAGFNVNANAARTGRCGMWIYTTAGEGAFSQPFQEIKCSPSTRYTAEAFFKKPDSHPWTTGTKAYLTLTFKDAYGVTLKTFNSQEMTQGAANWTPLTVTAASPANARLVRFTVNLTSSRGQSVCCVDQCSLKMAP